MMERRKKVNSRSKHHAQASPTLLRNNSLMHTYISIFFWLVRAGLVVAARKQHNNPYYARTGGLRCITPGFHNGAWAPHSIIRTASSTPSIIFPTQFFFGCLFRRPPRASTRRIMESNQRRWLPHLSHSTFSRDHRSDLVLSSLY